MIDHVEKWQTGDRRAFEELFRQYESLVFKTAYLITGNKEDAADALQEVFISVWKSRHTYDPHKGKLTTWLHCITVNQCSSKKARKTPVAVSLEAQAMDLPEIKNGSQPEEVLVSKLEFSRMLSTLKCLDTKHRSVLVLRYFDDLSYQEMAEVLEIPLGTVKSRLSQSLRLLRARMDSAEVSE